MAEVFLDQIKANSYWTAGDKVVVGVSGGVDSMVLFNLLHHLPSEFRPEIVAAHVNHHLRSESDEDEAFVKQWMERCGIPVHIFHWTKDMHPETGIEAAARNVRYRFFNETAEKCGSQIILTAHHRDDQVETVMMRFVRGGSLDELTGISAARRVKDNTLIRLLLPFSKETIREYALENDVDWREDKSNASLDYTRNRYRNQIIPELKKENPLVEQHIYDFSKDIEDLLEAVKPMIEKELSRSFQFTRNSMTLNLSSFSACDRGFQKIVLRYAFKKFSGQNSYVIRKKNIDDLVDWFTAGGPNTTLELPNQLIAQKEYTTCRIKKVEETTEHTGESPKVFALNPNEWINLSETEKVGCVPYQTFIYEDINSSHTFFLGTQEIAFPLIFRHRRPGDRMAVKGLHGSKKLKDIFIDQKVPKKDRDEAWVVTDCRDQIIWVAGYKESSLSRNPLTDTISFVLVYQKDNEAGME